MPHSRLVPSILATYTSTSTVLNGWMSFFVYAAYKARGPKPCVPLACCSLALLLLTPPMPSLLPYRSSAPAAVHAVIRFATQLPKGVNQRELAPSGASLHRDEGARCTCLFFAVRLLDYGGGAARQDSGCNHPGIVIAVSISGHCRQSLAMMDVIRKSSASCRLMQS
jgi:hypothetical protein